MFRQKAEPAGCLAQGVSQRLESRQRIRAYVWGLEITLVPGTQDLPTLRAETGLVMATEALVPTVNVFPKSHGLEGTQLYV
jgi:hypothetical protein